MFKMVPTHLLTRLLILLLMLLEFCCAPGHQNQGRDTTGADQQSLQPVANPVSPANSSRNRPAGVKVIRVVVALCDNVHQA